MTNIVESTSPRLSGDGERRSRRVIYRRFGGPEVLEIVSRSIPRPAPAEVLVRVAAAGVNPVDWKIFSGEPMFESYDRTLPSGTGYDFAGTVVACGSNVDAESWLGARVFGGLRFHAQADHLVIEPQHLARVPDGLSMIVAGALNVVGRTAMASVRSQHIESGDTVLVSGAAGGVGILSAQLAAGTGARVIGTASTRNHERLRGLGIEPLAYGTDLVHRLRATAPRIDVVLDTVGHGTVDAALTLGVARERINTIADYPARSAHAVQGVGGAEAGIPELTDIAGRLARREIVLPIDSVHPLEGVRDAYARSITGHASGKIVVVPDASLLG